MQDKKCAGVEDIIIRQMPNREKEEESIDDCNYLPESVICVLFLLCEQCDTDREKKCSDERQDNTSHDDIRRVSINHVEEKCRSDEDDNGRQRET
jgi:hypothetical protein